MGTSDEQAGSVNFLFLSVAIYAAILLGTIALTARRSAAGNRMAIFAFGLGLAGVFQPFLGAGQVWQEKLESAARERRADTELRRYFAEERIHLDKTVDAALRVVASGSSVGEIRTSLENYDRAAAKLGPVSGVPGGITALASVLAAPATRRSSAPSSQPEPAPSARATPPVTPILSAPTTARPTPSPVVPPPIVPVIVPPIVAPPPPIMIPM